MNKNEYRRALVMLRSQKAGISGYVRLERRTLMGTLQFTVNGVQAGAELIAVLLCRQNGEWNAVRLEQFGAPRSGQTGLVWKFDPRNIQDKTFEQYDLAAVIEIHAGACHLLMCGSINGTAEVDWNAVELAACRLVSPVRITGKPIPPISEKESKSDDNSNPPVFGESMAPAPDESPTAVPDSGQIAEEMPTTDQTNDMTSATPSEPHSVHSSSDDIDSEDAAPAEEKDYPHLPDESLQEDEEYDENMTNPPAVQFNLPGSDISAGCIPDEQATDADDLDRPAIETDEIDTPAREYESDPLDQPAAETDEFDVPAENTGATDDGLHQTESSEFLNISSLTAGEQLSLSNPSDKWPEAIEGLRSLFFSSESVVPFHMDGFVFIRTALPDGSLSASCLCGIQCENGIPAKVCYAIPAQYTSEPPAGLEDYSWVGDRLRGYWTIIYTL